MENELHEEGLENLSSPLRRRRFTSRKACSPGAQKRRSVQPLWWTDRHPTQSDNPPSCPAKYEKKPTWHPGKGRMAGCFQAISHSSIFASSVTEMASVRKFRFQNA